MLVRLRLTGKASAVSIKKRTKIDVSRCDDERAHGAFRIPDSIVNLFAN
jgi:hypothetical protein